MPKITAIELENFQTLGKRTLIPIEDITLMFGPNGAGKSAVFDALDLMKLILSDDWGYECSTLEKYIYKSSRNSSTENPTNSLAIGIHFHIEENWSVGHLSPYEGFSKLPHIAYASLDSDHGIDFLNKNFIFFIKFEKSEHKSSSWRIAELVIKNEDKTILELLTLEKDKWPIATLYQHDWLELREDGYNFPTNTHLNFIDGKISGRVSNEVNFTCSPRSWFDHRGYRESHDREVLEVMQEVIDLFKILISDELKDRSNIGIQDNKNYPLPIVKASRKVPAIRDVISIMPGGKRGDGYRLEWSSMLTLLKNIINKNEEHWIYLCEAIVSSASSDKPDIAASWEELGMLDRVNSLLRDELFIDNGYQVTGEIFCLTPINDIEEFEISIASYSPKIVHLSLTDNNQQKLEIEDVGSGIGYVLPVLASLVQDGISLIQQPELHLHPALQSNLGDAVMRSVENKSHLSAFTLIETHSEHLLLRIMRLIKNANQRKGEVLNPISYDRVAILYFDPLPNGETQVKRLRLAPDGQLVDRWPGGFFNERFKDIFDE